MSKKFNIKPPVWPRELTFEEFKKLNPQINENQIINLYNQVPKKIKGKPNIINESFESLKVAQSLKFLCKPKTFFR